MQKRKSADIPNKEITSSKKNKKEKLNEKSPIKKEKKAKQSSTDKGTFEKASKFTKNGKTGTKFQSKTNNKPTEKPEDWNQFKKKKKELKLKRKQQRTGFDLVVKAKQIGEKLRCKNLKGGQDERNKLINDLHSLLKGKKMYEKFVLAHDTSRIIQWLLKYSSAIVKEQISEELIPVTVEMLTSKYGTHCARRLLKYGSPNTKSLMVQAMYGHVTKLVCHSLCASVFDLAYTTCASTLQKQHLVQEFFGGIYRNSKDDNVKSLPDVYRDCVELKKATLSATKANLVKAITSGRMDSALVQTVLYQYFTECSQDDKTELISQLIPHIVVISNSKDGAKAAMQCLWLGTNKDRKAAMKIMKEHVVEMSKHEHAHCAVITLLDTADDTVVLHKIILSEILKAARDLAVSEWGRKVLLWLVAPADSTCFHPVFVKELEEGRKISTSKKDAITRRKEILGHSINTLVDLVAEEPEFWLGNSSLAYEMLVIIKAATGDETSKAIETIAKTVANSEWTIKVKDADAPGIEDAGHHMILKKLLKHNGHDDNSFVACLTKSLTSKCLEAWLKTNRGCFVLVTMYESGTGDVQDLLKEKLTAHRKFLKKQSSQGAKILLNKIK